MNLNDNCSDGPAIVGTVELIRKQKVADMYCSDCGQLLYDFYGTENASIPCPTPTDCQNIINQ